MKPSRIIGILLVVDLILALLFMSVHKAHAAEVDYTVAWCKANGGVWERKDTTLPDGTYADCITKTHIVEVDYAHKNKHYEGIGQAVHYYFQNGARLKPLLLLIVDPNVKTDVRRFNSAKEDGEKMCPRIEVRMLRK